MYFTPYSFNELVKTTLNYLRYSDLHLVRLVNVTYPMKQGHSRHHCNFKMCYMTN